MAFTAIEPAPGLSRAQRRRVAAVGPTNVLLRTGYPSLLRSAGFVDVVADDVTAAYRATLAAWHEETRRRSEAVVDIVGLDEFEERQQRRAGALAVIDAGWLRRSRYIAHRTGDAPRPSDRGSGITAKPHASATSAPS